MRKKIILIIFIFVSVFIFSEKVFALDHSLNYDIEEFEIDSNGNLHISGWAFIHNYDNCGIGTDCSKVWYKTYSGGRYVNYKENLMVDFRFVDSNNNDVTQPVSAKFSLNDFTNHICFKSGSVCYDNEVSEQEMFGYKNVRFSVSIPLNGLFQDKNNSGYDLKIRAKLIDANGKEIQRDELLAVDKDVVRKSNSSWKDVNSNIQVGNFVVSGLKDTVKVTGSKVSFRGLDVNSRNDDYTFDNKEIMYWQQASGFVLHSRVENKSSGGPVNYYLYSSRKNYYTSSVCGYKSGEICTGICNPNVDDYCLPAIISSTFVKPSGTVKIKFVDNSKYCSVSNNEIDDCNAPARYSCDSLMTVKAGNYTANVYPSENANLNLNDDYHLQTIYSGGGFNLGITYTDVVSFNIKDNNYSNASNGNKSILDYIKDNYIRFRSVDSFKVNLNKLKVKDMYLDNDILGSWNCSQSENRNNSAGTLEITTTCSFSPYYVYYDYDKDKLIYSPDIIEDESVFDLSYNYYVSMRYCSNNSNGGKYRFKIYSDEDLNLSNLKVAINKNHIVSPKISIKTDDEAATCYINVRNYFYDCVEDINGDYGDGSSDRPSGSEFWRYKFVYRSIDVSNPFPAKKPSNYPDNWRIYFEKVGSLERVKNSYVDAEFKIEYRTIELTSDKLKNLRRDLNVNYTSWNNIKNDGTSIFISGDYFKDIKRHHSKLGEFNEGADKL